MSSTIEWEENYNFNGCYTYTIYSTITYELSGGWLRATKTDPAECPDVRIIKVAVDEVAGILRDGEWLRGVVAARPWTGDVVRAVKLYTRAFDYQRDDVREKILQIEKAGDE